MLVLLRTLQASLCPSDLIFLTLRSCPAWTLAKRIQRPRQSRRRSKNHHLIRTNTSGIMDAQTVHLSEECWSMTANERPYKCRARRVFVSGSPPRIVHVSMELRNATVSDPRSYQIVKLPPKRTQVTIFVDPETESKPTTENTAPDGQSNVFLMQLYLDRLGAFDQVLRFLGLLSTLYVMNATPWSETSSAIHSHDGAR